MFFVFNGCYLRFRSLVSERDLFLCDHGAKLQHLKTAWCFNGTERLFLTLYLAI